MYRYTRHAFESLSNARDRVTTFVRSYNHERRHSAIGFVTPRGRAWIRRRCHSASRSMIRPEHAVPSVGVVSFPTGNTRPLFI
ncbi:integrase core domain-containing protein [Eoetvoesiella caeni]